jgi:CRP-like cAMP-binding protein
MPSIGDRDPRRNTLLKALPAEEYVRLERHLQVVAFPAKQAAYEANETLTTVYFPLTGVMALVTLLEGGQTLAVASIGNEGFTGHALVLGTGRMPYHVVCEVASSCAAVRADTLRDVLRLEGRFQSLLLRNTQALFNQVAQIAACNRVHAVEQRLARSLLTMHSQTGMSDFAVTHEFLAEMLGVRRASVTGAASALQRAGLIRNARGHIVIRNRAGLDAAACECHRAIERQYERVLRAA